jgi:NADH-quinone oxidoreductase subunit C
MTVQVPSKEIAKKIEEKFPGSVLETTDTYLLVKSDSLYEIAAFLKDAPELDFKYLSYITAIDFFDYFEVIYQLMSLEKNHTLVLKTRCYDRENPALPSVYNLWQGADFQECEIYDLMGITFQGHPDMKRIFLWDGFQGYPLRKDYL